MKAARELLRWNQERLAETAGLSIASVRRYEAAKEPIAASIEEGILGALQRAGVVFVAEGEFADTPVSGGVLLRTSAEPDERAEKKIYVYGATTPPGRPVGRVEPKSRKPRTGKKPEED